MNALQILQSWGFPRGVDNTRIKPWVLYDTQTAAAGTLEYNFFQQSPSDIFERNRQLPLSGDETLLIEKIRLIVETTTVGIDLNPNLTELLTRSYLEVLVNDTQKIKIPLYEIINITLLNSIGNAGTGLMPTVVSNSKILQFPIILFKRANTQFKIVLSANAATAINALKIKIELSGVKFDFIIPNELDPVANNKYEKLSTTLYNTETIVAAANTYSLFSNRSASLNNINKVFPLSDSEVFSIEAVEIVNFAYNTTAPAAAIVEAQQQVLKINVNQTEFYFGSDSRSNTLFIQRAGTFSDAGAVATNFVYNGVYTSGPNVLGLVNKGVPIMIPANSQVDITLQQPATSLTNFVMVMLKGTLERRIS